MGGLEDGNERRVKGEVCNEWRVKGRSVMRGELKERSLMSGELKRRSLVSEGGHTHRWLCHNRAPWLSHRSNTEQHS